jgi:hypothetical protein
MHLLPGAGKWRVCSDTQVYALYIPSDILLEELNKTTTQSGTRTRGITIMERPPEFHTWKWQQTAEFSGVNDLLVGGACDARLVLWQVLVKVPNIIRSTKIRSAVASCYMLTDRHDEGNLCNYQLRTRPKTQPGVRTARHHGSQQNSWHTTT